MRNHRPTAAKGHIPFPNHRTVAEVDKQSVRINVVRRVKS